MRSSTTKNLVRRTMSGTMRNQLRHELRPVSRSRSMTVARLSRTWISIQALAEPWRGRGGTVRSERAAGHQMRVRGGFLQRQHRAHAGVRTLELRGPLVTGPGQERLGERLAQ